MSVQYVESHQLISIRNHHRILLVVVTMIRINIRIVIIIITDNIHQIIIEVQQIDNLQTIVQQCLIAVNLVVDMDMDMDIHLHHHPHFNVLRDT